MAPEQKSFCPCGAWGLVCWHTEAFWFPKHASSLKQGQKLFYWIFMAVSFHSHDWLHIWPLADSTSSSFSLPRDQEWAENFNLLIIYLVILGTNLHYWVESKIPSLINKTSSSHLWYRSFFKNCGWRPNISEKYIFVIWMTKYIFLISHKGRLKWHKLAKNCNLIFKKFSVGRCPPWLWWELLETHPIWLEKSNTRNVTVCMALLHCSKISFL